MRGSLVAKSAAILISQTTAIGTASASAFLMTTTTTTTKQKSACTNPQINSARSTTTATSSTTTTTNRKTNRDALPTNAGDTADQPGWKAMTQEEKREQRRVRNAAKKLEKLQKAQELANNTPGVGKLRILALHGGMSCAKKFKSGTMKKLLAASKDIADFTFLDAPFLTRTPRTTTTTDDEDDNQGGGAQHEVVEYDTTTSPNKRSWWGWNSSDPMDDRYAIHGVHQDGMFYARIEETMEVLWKAWTAAAVHNEENNYQGYDGLFGFSQGAITSSMFADWMVRTKAVDSSQTIPLPKFIILVSGFLKPLPLNMPAYWIDPERSYTYQGDTTLTAAALSALLETAYAALRVRQSPILLDDNGAAFSLSDFERRNAEGFDPTDAADPSQWYRIHGGGDDSTNTVAVAELAAAAPSSLSSAYVPTKKCISTIPSLHIYGLHDTIMPASRSLALAERYENAQRYRHENKRGHDVPNDPEGIKIIVDFLASFIIPDI